MMKYRLTTLLFGLIAISACGGGKENSSTTTIEGRILKGAVSYAQVTAYTLDKNGDRKKLKTITSDEKGNYALKLKNKVTTPVLIVAKGNGTTTMKCDTHITCKTPDTETISFGEEYSVSDQFELSAVLPDVKNKKINTVNVSLFSHLAASLLSHKQEKYGQEVNLLNAAIANAKITDLLQDLNLVNIRKNIISTSFIDISDSEEVKQNLEFDSLSMSLLQASVARLIFIQINDSSNSESPATVSKVIKNFVDEYLMNDGELKLYAKASPFSVQSLLEGIQAEAKALESRHQGVNLAALYPIIEAELDELNLNSDKKPAEIVGGDVDPTLPSIVDDEALTSSGLYAMFEEFLFLEQDPGKHLMSALRTLGHTLEENSIVVRDKFIDSMGGEISVSEVSDDFLAYRDVAAELYPKAAGIIVAMIRMGEADGDLTYDLALDEKSLLPDNLVITGTVVKTSRWGRPVLTLDNGHIEGLGDISLQVSAWGYSYCYYCYGNEYVSIDLKASGKYGEITFKTWGADLDRSWSWADQTDVPRRIDISDAQVSFLIHKEGATETLSVTGADLDMTLSWPSYSGLNYLPTLDSMSISGDFYNKDYYSDLRSFSGRLSYNNFDWRSYATHPTQWVKDHSDAFSVTASFDARLKVPDPELPWYAQYKTVGVSASLRNSRYSGLTQTLSLRYDQEYFGFQYRNEDRRFEVSNQAGAVVELLLSDDAKSLILGSITHNGKEVAEISNTDFGPVIRYSDGTIESI